MSNDTLQLLRLRGSVQNYPWGKQGSSSLVSNFLKRAVDENSEVDEQQYYAELWMGTHPNGPATLWDKPETSLHGLITSSPRHFLGSKLTQEKFTGSTQVPFLFKILSIAKALPLQAHPDKKLGEKLHNEDPSSFVDSNHKPEIAVALKDGFKGFVGFQELGNIVEFVKSIPELQESIGNEKTTSDFVENPSKETLKAVFTKLLTADTDRVTRCVNKLVTRVERQGADAVCGNAEVADVIHTLNKQYPGDVGVLAAPFFMNLVTLNRGESVYIGADEAHAYLEGDIIECMAVSDNVLNAAFVPPDTRNTSTFVESLTYTSRPPSNWALPKKPYKKSKMGKTTCFDPPLEEFTVLWTQLGEAGKPELQSKFNFNSATSTGDAGVYKIGDEKTAKEILEPAAGPTIGIVTKGKVEFVVQGGNYETLSIGEGGIVFVKPEVTLSVQAVEGEGEVWWATCSD